MKRQALRAICSYRIEKIEIGDIDSSSYISTENLLPNKAGKSSPNSVPASGKVSRYLPGDTLVSNIRPYFKKIWLADCEGGCSNDVLVFKPENCNSQYLYWVLSSDDFFDYATATSKGTKMPRGDKTAIMAFEVPCQSNEMQQKVAAILNPLNRKIKLNARINGCLEETCVALAHNSGVKADAVLGDVCSLVTEKCPASEAEIVTYVSSENLLPNYGGKQEASSLPTEGVVTVFRRDDILISNIRPYFKKIWYASTGGTCSTDVIVLRAKDHSASPYFYSCLRQDSFFSYVMAGAKGTKMPRGDKRWIMKFPIGSACPEAELKAMTNALAKVSTNNQESRSLVSLRDALLPKLMSGEIDVSDVDITQPNRRLYEC